MDEGTVAEGNLQTLVGEYTPLSPSTYFSTENRDQAGYRADTDRGRTELRRALDHTFEHHSPFIFSIDERETLTATPLTTQTAYESLLDSLDASAQPHWVVTFDLRYDYDATPNKPHEILHR